ncbi:unnamed protein product [marine sediment metagenome]|uniref:BFN domain-containing protein n=1 Tax=marine sediment metagenome TaxID=412755 RepID=X1AJ31_9ZZZZ
MNSNNNKKKSNSIKLLLEGIRLEVPSKRPLMLLKEANGSRYLPIWIGLSEAYAIALELKGYKPPRPMTHDLTISLIKHLNTTIKKVSITNLINNTFYAEITLIHQGKIINLSSRPSDAVAIAIRAKVPIFASEKVLDIASITIKTADDEIQRFKSFLDTVKAEDFRA